LINSIQYTKNYEDLQILLIKRFLKYNDENSKKLYIKAIESVNSYSTMKLLIDDFDNYKSSISLEAIVTLLNAIKYNDLLEQVLIKIINYLNDREINILLENLLSNGAMEKFNTVIKSAILKIM
jgi:23S rRNA maturation mini-RNase III